MYAWYALVPASERIYQHPGTIAVAPGSSAQWLLLHHVSFQSFKCTLAFRSALADTEGKVDQSRGESTAPKYSRGSANQILSLAALHCCGVDQPTRKNDSDCVTNFTSLNILISIMVLQLGAGGPQIAQTSAPHCLHSHLRASHSQVLPSHSAAIKASHLPDWCVPLGCCRRSVTLMCVCRLHEAVTTCTSLLAVQCHTNPAG